MSKPHLAVVGAGIAGLSCAAAWAQRGGTAVVYERATEISEVGAGIQLGPNAVKVLQQIGAQGVLAKASRPADVRFFDAMANKPLLTLPLGETAHARYNAPFVALHRADLIDVLADLCRQRGVSINTGSEVGLQHNGDLTRHGQRIEADQIAVADGINSMISQGLFGASKPEYTGSVAWRALVPATGIEVQGTRVWLGPGAHLVAYPIRNGSTINVVAVTTHQPLCPQDYGASADPKAMQTAFAGFPEEARDLVRRADGIRAWGLYKRRPLQNWRKGNITLIGDAAHPMLPYLAQGAAMAIEDAAVFARACFSEDPDGRDKIYQTPRRARTQKVAKASARQAFVYHARGPLRLARNAALKALNTRSPADRLRPFDWLYGAEFNE